MHRQWQQEGQLLDDGRHRPVRPVLGVTRRSHPSRRYQGPPRQPGQPGVHRDLEPGFHPVQRKPGRHLSAPPCQPGMSIPAMGFERVTSISAIPHRRRSPISPARSQTTRRISSAPSLMRSSACSGKKIRIHTPAATGFHRDHRAGENRYRLPRHRRSTSAPSASAVIADGIQPGNSDR